MSFSGSRSGRAIVPQLARLLSRGTMTGVPEAQLLEAFIASNDESAFEAIVTRHGPMVLKVCRQILNDPNDVDDAFQATFIVLARRASSLRRRDLLGNWLYGVAYRVARRARSLAAQRADRISDATPIEALSSCDPASFGIDPDALLQLHEAVRHLPDRYRIPVVLCYFEGLTHEEAAQRLGWPLGSVKGRLARAKDLLRKRLVRRGVGLSAGAMLAGVEQNARAAVVPHLLQIKVVRSALAISGESARAFAATSAISISVATLAQGVIRTMVMSQIRAIVIPAVIGFGIVSSGATVIAFQQGPGSEKAATASAGELAPDPSAPKESPGGRAAQSPKQRNQNNQAENKPAHNPGNNQQDQTPRGLMRPMLVPNQEMRGRGMGGMVAPGQGMMGMRGGGGGFGGGAIDPEGPLGVVKRQRIESLRRQINASLASTVAEADKNPKTKAILKKLDEPIAMAFQNETPLEDVLKYIQSATSSSREKPVPVGSDPAKAAEKPKTPSAENYPGIPIYVEPKGLQEAEKTLQSPVTIDVEGVSLKTTLRLILKQLGLAYCVHDGLLVISDPRGVYEELVEACAELGIPEAASDNPLGKELQGLESNGMFGGGGGGMR